MYRNNSALHIQRSGMDINSTSQMNPTESDSKGFAFVLFLFLCISNMNLICFR